MQVATIQKSENPQNMSFIRKYLRYKYKNKHDNPFMFIRLKE